MRSLERRAAVQARAIPAALADRRSGDDHDSLKLSSRFLQAMSPDDVETEIAATNARTLSPYERRIRDVLAAEGLAHVKIHHVLAWMYTEHSTLDHLSGTAFDNEVLVAAACAISSDDDQNDRLAASYGIEAAE